MPSSDDPEEAWHAAPDVCTHVAINHESDGRPWHQSVAVVPRLLAGEPTLDPGRVQRAQSADFDVTWRTGTRWADTITTRLGMWNQDPVEITYDPHGIGVVEQFVIGPHVPSGLSGVADGAA